MSKPKPETTCAALMLACVIAITSVFICSRDAAAVPYFGQTFTYFQPDTSTFTVQLYGDEFFAYQRTLDGREIVKDEQTGFWCYASLAADGRSFISTGIPVSTAAPGSSADNARLALASGAAPANQTLPADVVMETVRAAQARFQVDSKGRPLRRERASLQGASKDAVISSPPYQTTTGDYIGLCILVDFSDQSGTIPQAQVDNFCNQPSGFRDFHNACSVREYYQIQSNGKFNFCNTVTAYVRMPKPKTYYDDGQPIGSKAQSLVSTALDILMAQGFDFTPLSRDSYGYILSMNIFYAGTCASGWSKGLWPHSWSIGGKTVDAAHNIRASSYQMSDMKSALAIGTFCHENGHMTCDFPDLYSYVNSSNIIGSYSLMSGGSWGGGDGSHPTNVDPYLKDKAGWADVVVVTSASHVIATVQADRNYFYKYVNPTNSREYFLFENRNNTGYEGVYGGATGSVQPGRGLVVWQIYEWGSNTYSSIQQTTPTFTTPYEAFIVEASPNLSYRPWYSAPSPLLNASDTFFSTQGANPLSDSSTPTLQFWDHSSSATGRTVNSGLVIHDYGARGAALSFTIGAGAVSSDSAIGLTVTQITANCDFGKTTPNQIFQVFNAGGGTLNYSVDDDAAWLTCSPSTGSVASGSKSITASFNATSLTAGAYTASITVSDPAATNTPQIIPVTLNVAEAPALAVSPTSISLTLWPGQVSTAKYLRIANTGGGTMNYTVAKTQPWIAPSITTGNCGREIDLSYLRIDSTGVAAGVLTDDLVVTATGAVNSPTTVSVTLNLPEAMVLVAPNGGETWLAGTTQTIRWFTSVSTSVNILLLRGGVVDQAIATSAPNTGTYTWALPLDLASDVNYRIRISTVDDAVTTRSGADFSISWPIYIADMSSDPGWALQGEWAYGVPAGGSGDKGKADPVSGFTSDSVVGYNLNGGYASTMTATLWATTPAFDCSNFTSVSLAFYRWLGVDQSAYDHAYIEASGNNGATWTRIWSNSTTVLDDGAWTTCSYDLHTVADRKANVKIRWGMGATNGSSTYCGWNIDDVAVSGFFSLVVNFKTDGTPGATLTGALTQSVFYGATATTVTANAPIGRHFANWTSGGLEVLTSNPLAWSNVTQSTTLTANFAINRYLLNYAAGEYGSLTGETSQTVTHGANGSEVTAVPADNYHFVNWSDGATANPRADLNVTTDSSVTANFAINAFAVTYIVGANGAISGATTQTVNYGGNSSDVVAIPSEGFHFINWSDGATSNPRSDANVTTDISVTANFEINTYTLSYALAANGTIIGATSQTVAHGGSGTTVTVAPDAGYRFVAWSDGATSNPRMDENVTHDLEVSATLLSWQEVFAGIENYLLGKTSDPTALDVNEDGQIDASDLIYARNRMLQ